MLFCADGIISCIFALCLSTPAIADKTAEFVGMLLFYNICVRIPVSLCFHV